MWTTITFLTVGSLLAAAALGARRQFISRRNQGMQWPTVAPPAVAPSSFRASPRPSRVVYYRTKDGKADYGFSIERQTTGSYIIYIVSQPNYGSRDTSMHATHRLGGGDRRYVCWAGTLNTEEEARQVAALWADSTQEYIRSGRRF